MTRLCMIDAEWASARTAKDRESGSDDLASSPSVSSTESCTRDGGKTLTAIAEGLNQDRVPTAQGGQRWYPSTVRAVLRSVSNE